MIEDDENDKEETEIANLVIEIVTDAGPGAWLGAFDLVD